MIIAEHTTSDGFTIRVFSSMYLDFGLSISKVINGNSEDLYYSPSALSLENYGFKAPDGMEYEDAEENDKLVLWTVKDWQDALESDADDFIEAFVSEHDI